MRNLELVLETFLCCVWSLRVFSQSICRTLPLSKAVFSYLLKSPEYFAFHQKTTDSVSTCCIFKVEPQSSRTTPLLLKRWQTKLSSSLFPRKTRSYTTLVVHQILSLGNSGQSMWMIHLPSPGSQVQTLVNFTTPVLWSTYS